jgi:hypothetical protein
MTILAVIHALSFLEADHCDDNLCEDIWFWRDINPNGYDK